MSNKNSKMQFIRSAGIIGSATFISRALGFVRDILIARYFGTGAAAQAFVVAFRIPNLLRDLVGEGAANAAFVPIFSEYRIKEQKELKDLIRVMFYIMLFTLSIIVILGIIFTPLIVRIIAPGFAADIEKLNLTISLTRFMFPYLFFIALTAFFMSILHTYRAFVVPAFGPCLLNISFIAMILFFVNSFKQPIFSLAVAVVIGGMLQLLIHIPPLFKRGVNKEYFDMHNLNFKHHGLKKIAKMFFPRALSAGVYQLNVFVDTICSSLSSIVGEGAVAAIYYANRIIQFPLSIFGVALSAVMLPEMSARVAEKDMAGLRSSLAFSLKTILFIMLPISFGIFILAQPLTKLLFQRGAFTSYSTQITSWALLFYSLSLFAYAGAGILRSAFYALHDTLTPVRTSVICLVMNLVLNIILMFPLKLGGIALASSISAVVNFILLYFILKRRIGGLQDFGIKGYVAKVVVASLIMSLFTNFLWQSHFFSAVLVVKLVFTIIASACIFFFVCVILKVNELNQITKWILRR